MLKACSVFVRKLQKCSAHPCDKFGHVLGDMAQPHACWAHYACRMPVALLACCCGWSNSWTCISISERCFDAAWTMTHLTP